jgi:hypothetical protein
MASAVRLVEDSLRNPLEHVGFRQRIRGIFTIELAPGVLGWLGLNHATRYQEAGQVEVNPVVGVRHQAVERLIAELRGEKYHEYLPPTVSTPIGYVMPERRYITWEFGGRHGMAAEPALIAAVMDYGLPFMRSLILLEPTLEAINQGLSQRPEYHVPSILEEMGRHQDAMAALARIVSELGERQDAAARHLSDFAAAFERRS